jgi:bacterioferritin-associated ferredoxin
VLDFSESTAVTDAGISAVVAACPLLEELNLDSMKITNASLSAIAHLCRNLTSLNVCGCSKITDMGVRKVMEHCPRLVALGVDVCKHVSWKLQSEVRKKYEMFW